MSANRDTSRDADKAQEILERRDAKFDHVVKEDDGTWSARRADDHTRTERVKPS
jgi:hypothetical protein